MSITVCFLLIVAGLVRSRITWQQDLVVDVCTDLVNAKHAVIFSCSDASGKEDFIATTRKLVTRMVWVQFVNLNVTNLDLKIILTRKLVASTCVVLDLACLGAGHILNEGSSYGYFNKSYQWLLLDFENRGLNNFTNSTRNIGLNAQVTYVNSSSEKVSELYDLHSKGQHLKSPLIATKYGFWSIERGLSTLAPIQHVQGVTYRRQFGGITLRGVVVIDRSDIRSSEVNSVMSNPVKMPGISPFSKYHFALATILQEYYNFSINYRITHGWAGRLPNSQFRLGLLGVVQRDEADIAASGVFNRINRFAEMDTIHQSWIFEAAFLYRMSAELKDQGSGGSFLSPFERMVWIAGLISIIVLGVVWKISTLLAKKWRKQEKDEIVSYNLIVNAIAALCQQGLVHSPRRTSARIIAFVLLAFTLLMYNFYTSSVVGGLLSTQAVGPQNLSQLIDSSLILSFEDIGYHKLIFLETNSSLVKAMYHTKVQPYRNPNLLPAYTTVKEAVPYLRTGGYAFHCEVIDAYSEIARLFDPNEICDLNSVSGLFDVQLMNMIVTKRSTFTEMFRIALHRAREIGLINRELRAHRPEKPRCQSGSTVHPVTLSGVRNAFVVLGVGAGISVILLSLEIFIKQFGYGRYKK